MKDDAIPQWALDEAHKRLTAEGHWFEPTNHAIKVLAILSPDRWGCGMTQTPEQIAAEACDTCQFSLMGVQGDPQHGLCRRYPPNDESRWPEISNEDWCGEYRAILKEQTP